MNQRKEGERKGREGRKERKKKETCMYIRSCEIEEY